MSLLEFSRRRGFLHLHLLIGAGSRRLRRRRWRRRGWWRRRRRRLRERRLARHGRERHVFGRRAQGEGLHDEPASRGEHGGDQGDGRDEANSGHGYLPDEERHPLREVAVFQERRRGPQDRRRPGGGELQQRFEVGLAGPRQADHFSVDHLLGAQPNLVDEPPDRRMEPQDREQRLVREGEDPVAAGHVQQLVRGYRGLLRRVERGVTGRHEHHGPEEAERHGPDDARRHEEAGVGADEARGAVDGLRPRVEQRRGTAKARQRQQAHAQPCQPRRCAGQDDGEQGRPDGPPPGRKPGRTSVWKGRSGLGLGRRRGGWGEALVTQGRRRSRRRRGHPRLQQRQREADHEERPEMEQPRPRRTHPEQRRQQHAGNGQRGHLDRPRDGVAERYVQHLRPPRSPGRGPRVPSCLDVDP